MKDNLIMAKIANELNQYNIIYAMGASKLLERYGLIEKSSDIDIFVIEEHFFKTLEILDSMGLQKDLTFDSGYLTKYLYEYEVDKVEVNIVAGMNMRHDRGIFKFTFDRNSIDSYWDFQGIKIPYMALEDWFVLYHIMPGKLEYAKKVTSYLVKKENVNIYLLERNLEKSLPTLAEDNLKRLISLKKKK